MPPHSAPVAVHGAKDPASLSSLNHQLDGLTWQIGDLAEQVEKLESNVNAATVQLSAIAKQLTPAPPTDIIQGFFRQMHAPDWVQAVLVFITFVSLIYTYRALKETARGRDVENYLKLLEMISSAWRQLSTVEEDEKYSTFLDLMNLLESCCHLYNKKVISGTTREMVREYLKDVLPGIYADENSSVWITKASLTSGTFEHIRGFAAAEGLTLQPR